MRQFGANGLMMFTLLLAQVNIATIASASVPIAVDNATLSSRSELLPANCEQVTSESSPLPARPILARSTFASPVPGRHKRPLTRKHRRPHRPLVKKKLHAPVKKASHKRIARRTLAKRPHAPHKIVHRHAHPRPAAGPGGGDAPLHRATFASPICVDRAPTMAAFGMDVGIPSLGEEFAQAVADTLAPPSGLPFEAINSGGPNGGGGPGISGGPPDITLFPQPIGPPSILKPPPPEIGPVPEPATWALMLIGFGALGGALRRRRRAAMAG